MLVKKLGIQLCQLLHLQTQYLTITVFFGKQTSFEAMPICENYYEATNTIISTGGVSWKTYINELLNIQKILLVK